MLILSALALLQAGPLSVVAANNSAIEAYREACVEGSLKLTPSRGRVLGPGEFDDFSDFLAWGQSQSRQTVIKLNDGPFNYIILTEYQHLQPGSVARTCALLSRSVSKREAMAAYVDGLPEKVVTSDWIPDMYVNKWTSDHPELGYRKLLRFRDEDRAIVLEIGMYPSSAAQMNAGKTKQ